MTASDHRYITTVTWTGNRGSGTSSYTSYDRDYTVTADAKEPILGSSDPQFRGDPSRWNPEELFVASLSACHKLWYLHLCAAGGVNVVKYDDTAQGVMANDSGGAYFSVVTLRPRVWISANSDAQRALALHHDANEKCFIARSVKCEVRHEPQIMLEAT
ncbi:MAG: OsmC family protein [Candidatus Eremiobacteraeota bacterium]|nr:OsmC family protein [Candidatus Eremiobacteraeota bacterium]